ncbi:MAG: AAA family ATPase, partial [Hydrotalea sp.]|nr:AAA family ATPase [Hydrotalea sp.]
LTECHFDMPKNGAMMTVITGNNGAGKTNLLEALSLLAPGRGLRATAGEEKVRFGQTRFRLRADFSYNQQPEILKMEYDATDKKIKSFLNHNPIKSSERNFSCLWVLPRHDRLFQDSASERRRFLDKLITAIHGNHQSEIIGFNELLRQRRSLLEQGHQDDTWLRVLEKRIAEKSIAIAGSRLAYIAKLNQAVTRGFQFLPPLRLALSGMVEEMLETTDAVEAEKIYQDYLGKSRGLETIEGVHRTDMTARHLKKDLPASLCSTGEQKLLVLGLMVGAVQILTAEFGRPPLFLLDDIVSHLDDDHQAKILRLFASLSDNLQVPCFLTGTRKADFSSLGGRAQFITLANGRILA